MENKEEIVKKLNSSDILLVQEAIEAIKQEGDLTIVPDLLELLLHCQDSGIVTQVTALLSDIKDSRFKQMLIEKLTTATRSSEKSNLLRICWESAIDFSEHLSLFVEILLNDDFISALEASTVIENLSGNINEAQIQEAIRRLQQVPPATDKAFLIEDTRSHLEEWLQQLHQEEEDYCCDEHDS